MERDNSLPRRSTGRVSISERKSPLIYVSVFILQLTSSTDKINVAMMRGLFNFAPFLLQCFSNLDPECFTSRKPNLWWDLGRKFGLWRPYGSGEHFPPSATFISIFYTAYKAFFPLRWPRKFSRLQCRRKHLQKKCKHSANRSDALEERTSTSVCYALSQVAPELRSPPCLYISVLTFKKVKPERQKMEPF